MDKCYALESIHLGRHLVLFRVDLSRLDQVKDSFLLWRAQVLARLASPVLKLVTY
jgi:hypothetical protein